jgi:hypothetical protein
MTNLKSLTFLFSLATLLFLSSCSVDDICTRGEGSSESYRLDLPTFTGIDLRIGANVYLSQGDTPSVRVIGQQNIVDKLKLEVDDLTWKIDLQGCTRDYEDLEIYITVPKLHYVKIGGSGDVVGETTFTVDDIDLMLSGSGNIIMPLNAYHVNTKVSGSGDIDLVTTTTMLESEISGSGNLFFSGETPSHICKIRGAGTLKAFDLTTDITDINISGSGDAEITARDQLDINITGSGDVRYRGNPTLTIDIDGSGRVVDAN